MVFNSPAFLIFLAISASVFYALPQKYKNGFLLLASYVYYMWAVPQYGILVVFSTVVSYFAAKLIDSCDSQKHRKAALVCSIIVNLGVLFTFKYFNFFMESVSALFGAAGIDVQAPVLSLILPVGISFYTFQVIGYNIDVYNKTVAHENNFFTYALFVSFFPQILAGPIGRAKEMLPQYKKAHEFEYHNVITGVQRFLMGAFKKVVIADGLAVIVDGIYGSLSEYTGFALIAAVVFYAIQVYFDFSGYSDMAIATAQILGFRLRENFTAPYFATNMSGFWKRWHMSLTSWFNDYIFTPLVWSRWANKLFFGKNADEHKPHFALNILIIFLISGLWHGASVTFVVWGLCNGLLRVGEELLHKIKPPKKKQKQKKYVVFAKRISVFAMFAFTLVFFRAKTITDALYVFKNMLSGLSVSTVAKQLLHLSTNGISTSGAYLAIFWGILALALLLGVRFDCSLNRSLVTKGQTLNTNPVGDYPKKLRWLLYWFMGISVMLFYFISLSGSNGEASFIYFGF